MNVQYNSTKVTIILNKNNFLAELSFLLENVVGWFLSKGMHEVYVSKEIKENIIIIFESKSPKIAAFSPVTRLSHLISVDYLDLKLKETWKIEGEDYIYKNINICLGEETSLLVNQSYESDMILADLAYGLADLLIVLLSMSSKIKYKISVQTSQIIFNKSFDKDEIMRFIDRDEDYDLKNTAELLCK